MELIEPPVPPGLGQLDPALEAFTEFFAIDEDLIAAAAEASPSLTGKAADPRVRGKSLRGRAWTGARRAE